ncbi:MAG: hypothetical protein JNK82_21735, partial [Myxococcaceae bacterium]|nr:hypothetical protein [Myxococcaceae bacterium]
MLRFSDQSLALFRQRRFALTFLGSTLAAWFILSRELTVNALGLQLQVVHAFSAWYFVTQLVIVFSNDELAKSPRWGWLRFICVVSQVSGGFIYGASSTLEVSPAWVFALAVAHLAAQYELHKSRWLMALFIALAPLLHVALAPHVTVLSFTTAVLVGLTAAVVLEVLGRRAAETASLDSTEPLGARELDARQRLLSRVAIAMAVHDQLSGLLVGGRMKLKRAKTWGDVADAIAALLGRAKGLLDDRPAPSGQLAESLRTAVEAHGAALDLRVEQRRPLDPAEEADLRDLVSEASVNAARSGSPVVQVHVEVLEEGISVLCTGSGTGPRAPGEGRGLRNMRLRSWARGGTFSFEANEAGSTLRVHWPRQNLSRFAGIGTAVLMISLAAVPAIAQGRLFAVACVVVIGVLAAGILRLADTVSASRALPGGDGGSADAMGRVRAALGPALAQLDAASAAESLERADEALRTLSTTFTALLAELERESLPLMPQLSAQPAKAAALVFERQHLDLLGWRLFSSTTVASVLLSLPQSVAVLQVAPLAFRVFGGFSVLFSLLVVLTVRQWATAGWAAPLRGSLLVWLGFTSAAAGAMSSSTFGPGWVIYVLQPAVLGQFPIHRSRAVLAA